MSENPIRLQMLFEKYTNNTCTKQELQEFWRLVGELSEDDLITEDLRKLWHEHRHLPHMASEVNWDKAYEKMMDKAESINIDYERLVKRPFKKWAGIAASVLVVAAGIGLWALKERRHPATTQDASGSVAIQHQTKRRFIRLPDGSTVIMNEGSTLTYPDSFSADSRKWLYRERGISISGHWGARLLSYIQVR